MMCLFHACKICLVCYQFMCNSCELIFAHPIPMSAPGTPRGPKGGYVGLRRQRGGAPSPPGKMAPTSPGRRMRDEVTPRESPTEGGQMSMSPRSPGGGQKKSIQIFGCTGKYSLINDTYEPLEYLHQNKPCWRARSEAPIYLFHTGKSRWVISKRINDGARCYAYVTDNGSDPSKCTGPWMCCDENGTWNKDDGIRCVLTVASNDQFTLLRNQVEADLAHYGLMDDESLKQMWRKLDRNGDNEASLAEVEALVTQMCDAKIWPKWINNPDSIKRAFEKAAGLDGANDEAVEKEEFHALLLDLFWFGHLHEIFEQWDQSHDNMLSLPEFVAGMKELGIRLTQEEAESEFRSAGKSMDGGLLPFSDFCSYVRQRVQPKHNANFDKKPVAKDAQLDTLRKSHGEQATHGEMMIKKTMADFDKLEKEIKGMIKDNDQVKLKKMWRKLDFNGNNVVSLAEIDKMAVEQFPLLNHKPALMRAYKASFGDEGDEFIHKREFKILLANLFYFNKLFWLFDQVDQDHDRRMDIKEFTWCMSMCGLKLSQPKLEAEFKKIDQNGGGIILFDEFCRYFTDRTCPEAMTDFIDNL